MRNAGIVVDSPATLVTIGDLTSSMAALAILGFIIMMVLDARKVPGAIVIGILVVTIIGLVTGDASWGGGAWLPPSLAPTFFALDLSTIFEIGLIVVVLTFLFVDFFDTAGTLTSVANMAGKVDADGKVEGIGRAVISDGAATTAGALLGTSSTTSYIESGAGIKEGGRTGLTAITVAVLFLLSVPGDRQDHPGLGHRAGAGVRRHLLRAQPQGPRLGGHATTAPPSWRR